MLVLRRGVIHSRVLGCYVVFILRKSSEMWILMESCIDSTESFCPDPLAFAIFVHFHVRVDYFILVPNFKAFVPL